MRSWWRRLPQWYLVYYSILQCFQASLQIATVNFRTELFSFNLTSSWICYRIRKHTKTFASLTSILTQWADSYVADSYVANDGRNVAIFNDCSWSRTEMGSQFLHSLEREYSTSDSYVDKYFIEVILLKTECWCWRPTSRVHDRAQIFSLCFYVAKLYSSLSQRKT